MEHYLILHPLAPFFTTPTLLQRFQVDSQILPIWLALWCYRDGGIEVSLLFAGGVWMWAGLFVACELIVGLLGEAGGTGQSYLWLGVFFDGALLVVRPEGTKDQFVGMVAGASWC